MKTRLTILLFAYWLGGCADLDEQPREAAPDEPPLAIFEGESIRGAGAEQQWEGIVFTTSAKGGCTASFITAQHLLSASHCYSKEGPQRITVRAPTWNGGVPQVFSSAVVKRSGTSQSLDLSVIDLGSPQAWATPERRFLIHVGTSTPTDLHLYGYGANAANMSGSGTLRGVPGRSTLHATPYGRNLASGPAGSARACSGDSGGPDLKEGTVPVIYGITQTIGGALSGACAATAGRVGMTDVSKFVSFIESALGTTCTRKRVDGLDVAQCW